MIGDFIKLSRPKHWIKNVFVLMPAPFALASGAEFQAVRFFVGLAAFCLANSAVYSFNDAQDAERDRLHDEKRNRPVAAGRISERAAYAYAALLVAAGTGLAYASGSTMAMVVFATYLVSNLFYSLKGKNIPLVDVFLLAGFFLLRFLLGCALLGVAASNWLLLCSSALALFLGLAKRRSDILKGLDESHRPALMGYNEGFLDHAMGITASMTIVAYALYSMEAEVLADGREFASLPFVVFGVLDILRKAHVERAGGSPVDLLLGSPSLIAGGFGWLISTAWSVRLFG
ncbi:MAG: UbiA prenyltransferase family protein [Myxococcales bacterium]|nr:UbiA prenyltransferase family protein [Myxococcales bacterium]MDD9965041.1 UbiA prenyltransferase family protein [Myxococcales bacterium]